jgi:hypothetical protein
LVFPGYVLRERSLSFLSLILAETSASLELTVSNDPNRWFAPAWGLQPQARPFASLRHRSLISLIDASVV